MMKDFMLRIAQILPMDRACLAMRSRLRLPGLLPLYHLVADQSPSHVKYLYQVRTKAEFERDLDYLCDHYTPVTLSEALADTTGTTFHLTFDDGLRQCYDVVAPILDKRGIRASFFINPAFMDNQGLMHRYVNSLLCDFLTSVSQDRLANALSFLQCHDINEAMTHILKLKYEDGAVIEELCSLVDLDVAAYLSTEQPYMTSAQVTALAADGHNIGSHGYDHPLYARLSLDDQVNDAEQSFRALADILTENLAFAFPFTDDGVSLAFWSRLRQTYPDVLTLGTAGIKLDSAPQHFQRTPMEVGSYSAADVVSGEILYYLLKTPLGKNTILRQ